MFKSASFGSISSGTLRAEDLLVAFADELEFQVSRNADAWCSDAGRAQRDAYMVLVGEARECDPDSEEATDVVAALDSALQEFAPAYGYFGSHPGDGADFGFWLSEFMEQDFDGLKVADTSEVPADYCGEVLHVNDHGNATLYAAERGQLREVWAVV
jgi:hypothetical protein